MTRVTESFQVHLSEPDLFALEDAYAEALLDAEGSCDYDEQGVFVWASVEVGPSPDPPCAAPKEWSYRREFVKGVLIGLLIVGAAAALQEWSCG
jgi:hypothetical protein